MTGLSLSGMRLCLLLQNDILRSLVLPKPFERRRTQQPIVSPSAVFDHAYKPRLGPPYPFVGCGRQLLAEVWFNGMNLLYIVAERSGLAGGPARPDATCIDELFTIIIAERYRADRSERSLGSRTPAARRTCSSASAHRAPACKADPSAWIQCLRAQAGMRARTL